MPFAGRIVVPNFLPVTATLANYLVKKDGSMQGLEAPLLDDLDSRLAAIDSDIILAARKVDEVIRHWLSSSHPLEDAPEEEQQQENVGLILILSIRY